MSTTFSTLRSNCGADTAPASVAALLSGLPSLAFATVAVLLSEPVGVPSATATGTRMAGIGSSGPKASERVQVIVWPLTSQSQPSAAIGPFTVRPAGSVSLTTTSPLVGPAPTLKAAISTVLVPPAT